VRISFNIFNCSLEQKEHTAYSAVFDEQITSTKKNIVKQIRWKLSITMYFLGKERFIFSQDESISTRMKICLCYIRPFFLWNVTFSTCIGAAYSLFTAPFTVRCTRWNLLTGNIVVIVDENVWKSPIIRMESKDSLASSIAQLKIFAMDMF